MQARWAPEPIEKDPSETPPILIPELPDDLPEKTFEEEVAERFPDGPVIVELGGEPPPIVPESGSAIPWAALGLAAMFLL